jgi:hypothetical protein
VHNDEQRSGWLHVSESWDIDLAAFAAIITRNANVQWTTSVNRIVILLVEAENNLSTRWTIVVRFGHQPRHDAIPKRTHQADYYS